MSSNLFVQSATLAILCSLRIVSPDATLRAQTPTHHDSTKAGGLDTVQVLAHYDNGVGTSNAASAGHVTRQLIADRPLLRPGEVLEYVPGMIITQHSGGGKANQYFLRGFSLDHGTDFETTLDGMPVNMPSHAHGQGYTDLNFMIPELIGGIDYAKGPYGAAQGDFATAGSAVIHYADRLSPSQGDITGGTHQYGRAVIVGAPQLGPGRLVYGAEADHVNGPWLHPDDYRKGLGVLRYVQPIAHGQWSLTAMGYDGRWSATDQIPQRAIADGRLNRFGTVDTSDGGKSFRYSLSGNFRTAIGGGQLETAVYGIRYALDLYSNFTFFLEDSLHGDQVNQHDNRTVLGWNGWWAKPMQLFGVPMTNTIGWDIRHDHITPVGLYHTENRQRLSTTLEDRVGETGNAVYVENLTVWTNWLRSIAGLRLERYTFSTTSNIAENSGTGSASIGLPKLSFIIGPWQQTEWFVNFGEGFHSNDVRGATERIDPSTSTVIDPVTPLVRGIGGEVGVRTERIPRLQSSLSVWALHLRSELVFDGDAGTTEAGRPSERIGIEWSNHYTPNQWLLIDLDLATTHARFTDTDPIGRYIPEALQATAAAGMTVHHLGPWTASLFMRYFGPRPLIESDSVRSPSTTLFNTQATYQVTPRIGVRADVFNIFDANKDDITYYYVSRLKGEPVNGVADLLSHPVESRSVRLGLVGTW